MPLLSFIIAFWALMFGAAFAQVIPQPSPPSAPQIVSGSQTVTASAAAMPSQKLNNGVVFKTLTTNTGLICIGQSNVTITAGVCVNGYPLNSGEAISYAASQLSAFYIVGTVTTDVITFTGN